MSHAVVLLIAFFSLSAAGSIRGIVRDVDGAPVEGAEVWLNIPAPPALTDSLGSWRMDGIDPGRYMLYARAEDLTEAGFDPVFVVDYAESIVLIGEGPTEQEVHSTSALNGRMVGLDTAGQIYEFAPLSTEIETRCMGNVQETVIRQSFRNETAEMLESAFVYPVPYYCFCKSFTARIGCRTLSGSIISTEAAELEYESAVEMGRESKLCILDMPYALNLLLGDIGPGETLDVEFSYLGQIQWEDGWFNIAIPRGEEPSGPVPYDAMSLEDVYLLDPGDDYSISMIAEYPFPLERTDTVLGDIWEHDEGGRIPLLQGSNQVLATDYLVRFGFDHSEARAGFLADDGFFMMQLILDLPASSESDDRNITLVVDGSNSTSFLQRSKAADFCQEFLSLLDPSDRFQVVLLGEDVVFFSSEHISPDSDAVARAVELVRDPLNRSLETDPDALLQLLSLDSSGSEEFVFLASDILFENEQLISALEENREWFSSVHFVNLGNSSSSRYEGSILAEHQFTEVLQAQNYPAAAAVHVWQRINGQCVVDPVFDFGDVQVMDIVPDQRRDVFSGEPHFIYGKYEGEIGDELLLEGSIDGSDTTLVIPTEVITSIEMPDLLRNAWAFRYCNMLAQRDPDDVLLYKALEAALIHSLESPWTALLLFDDSGDCASVFPAGIGFNEFFAGRISGMYLGVESRPILTLQRVGRGNWR